MAAQRRSANETPDDDDDVDDTTTPGYSFQAVRAEEAMWRTIRANDYKSCIGICSVAELIVTVILIVTVVLAHVPFFMPSLIDYGFIYHAAHAAHWILALAASGMRNTEMFEALAFLTIPVLLLDAWALFVNLLPWLIGCIIGSPVTFFYDCVTNAPVLILLFVMALIEFIASLVIFMYSLGLLSYIRNIRNDTRALPREVLAAEQESKQD